MEKRFTVCASLIDTQKNKQRSDFFVLVNTAANRTFIYQLDEELADTKQDARVHMKEIFGKLPDYQIRIRSEFLIRLVDTLGGIDFSNRHISGIEAMEEVYSGHFDLVIEAIAQTLGKKNLLLTVPGLLNVLSDTYETDLSLVDAIKTFVGEIHELDDWKIELIEVNKYNVASLQKLL